MNEINDIIANINMPDSIEGFLKMFEGIVVNELMERLQPEIEDIKERLVHLDKRFTTRINDVIKAISRIKSTRNTSNKQ